MNTLLHILLGTERGGCEANALNLVKASPQIRHVLLVLGKAGPMSLEFEAAGVEVRHAAVLGTGMRPVIRSVEASALDWEPWGVIAWHGMVALPEILHALRDFSGKVLVHGGNPAHSMPPFVDWRYFLRERFLGPRCEATYVCCSQFVADSFSGSRYLRRFPACIVPNGIQPPQVALHDPRPLGPESTVTIGMTARLDEIKDHTTLLHAFSTLLETHPLATLELLGDGELRTELETLSINLGIQERVNFRGMVADVYAEMADWDLFVYSTTDREGLGNALIEAMMLGLPCVVTDAGPMRELVGDPPTVLLTVPADSTTFASAIRDLIGSVPSRTALAEASKMRARSEYSCKKFAQSYLKLLEG